MLPHWMYEKEDYEPEIKKGGLFSNEKLLKGLLSKLHTESKVCKKHPFHPLVYLVNIIIISLILCFTYNKYVIWIIGIYAAALLLRVSNKTLVKIIKQTLGLFVLNLVLYSPSIILGTGNYVFLIKMFLLFLSLITYASTTSVYDFLTALKQLHVPNFIIFQVDIFVKHLHILGSFLLKVVYAIEARSVGSEKGQNKLMGTIFGNLYLEMVKFGKELYNALEARAFTGKYDYMIHKLNWKDYALIFIQAVLLVLVILIGRG